MERVFCGFIYNHYTPNYGDCPIIKKKKKKKKIVRGCFWPYISCDIINKQ